MTTTAVATHTATDLEWKLLAAVREFVSYSMCRQANTAERKMLAEQFALLGEKYGPILEHLGLSPSQVSQVKFEAIANVAAANAVASHAYTYGDLDR